MKCGTNHVPTIYREIAKGLRDKGITPLACAERFGGDPEDKKSRFREASFACAFGEAGAPTYVLSHSIAAALTATRAPTVAFAHCPYDAFLIEVPSEFLPIPNIPPPLRTKCWIAVLVTPQIRAVSLHAEGIRGVSFVEGYGPFGQDASFGEEFVRSSHGSLHFETRLAVRLASNTIAYVVAHRASVTRREGTPSDVRLLDVGAPHDVRIDREFRMMVRDLVAARTIPRARGVLAHMVRGHWKRAGVDKGLIWIAPYRRGDENIGRVVERIDRL